MARNKFKPFQEIASLEPISKGERRQDVVHVQEYLCRFGYLNENFEKGCLDVPTQEAIESYQRRHKRRPTGTFNKATRKQMTVPRCGVKDRFVSPFALTAEEEECRWDKEVLTFAFDSTEPLKVTFDRETYHREVGRAFSTWQRQLPVIRFEMIDEPSSADIAIGWRRSENHADGDFESNVVAHADFPGSCAKISNGLPKPIHFNGTANVPWIADPDGPDSGFDLQTVALHEIGHILGLHHSEHDPDAVMDDTIIQNSDNRTLQPEDTNRIKALYGIGAVALTAESSKLATLPDVVVLETILRRIENIEHELAGLRELVRKLEA